MSELFQLLDEKGNYLIGKGASKTDVWGKGLLHAASHIWMWRVRDSQVQVLLQKRAAGKATYPNLYDISAAGHIDLGESPEDAAIREIQEEIGLNVQIDQLKFIGKVRTIVPPSNGNIENEFRWLYLLNLDSDTDFTLQKEEVESLKWINVVQFKEDVLGKNAIHYVPQGEEYFRKVIAALEQESQKP